MYRIVPSLNERALRLVAHQLLSRPDFEQIASELAVSPREARKVGFVAARRAAQNERIETLWNGRETVAQAQRGDWIATNLSADKEPLRDAAGNLNVYVIAAARFPELYRSDGSSTPQGEIYRPWAVVHAIYFPGGFEIFAPWGEIQRADAGYLIDNGAEVYGNAKETFERTYAWVS